MDGQDPTGYVKPNISELLYSLKYHETNHTLHDKKIEMHFKNIEKYGSPNLEDRDSDILPKKF